MTDLLWLFVPFFLLVLCGWGAVRAGLVDPGGIGALNGFVLFFGLPAMLFRLGASGALVQPGLPGLLLAYGVGGATVTALALWLGRRSRWSHRDTGLVALAAAFPNTGFLGLPLLTGLLGAQAAGPVAATLIIDVLLLSSLCLAWAHRGASGSWWGLWVAPLKGALRNPLLWSMALGVAWWASGWQMVRAFDDTLRLLALAASPAALFTLGAILARAQLKAGARVAGGSPLAAQGASPGVAHGAGHGSLSVLVVAKLLLHPLLVLAAGELVHALGWPLSGLGLSTLVMAAALPSASNVSMLAEREGADTTRVARLIMWTTALSWLTLAAWAAWRGAALPASG
ncbi:AEC family transporter [Aquabacterium parvum]|uniref:AEC family transporter n=1 Tax=Aquabacterium parvum TaxID=70584 RepID=UPI000718B9B0|nr:AEC family transporter [Aquabacterium parvum]MBU0916708.1 AEC family transporter [Gammaproteobacteria bacterium]